MYTIQNNQITFLDARYYVTPSNNYVPSVTHVLDCFPKGAAYFDWLKKNGVDADDIRDEAGRRGSVVHNLTERYDNGEEVRLVSDKGNIDFKLGEWAMFERYVDFRNRFKFDVKACEMNIISEQLGYAGTLDRIIEMDGESILLDIKTSNAIYPSYWLQLAAYRRLLEVEKDIKVDHVAILWLNAKTRTEGKKGQVQGIGWQMITKDDISNDLRLFDATYQLWKAENETMKPRQVFYQLTHKL